jgi:hypothetical protein
VNAVLYPACALVALVAFLYKLRALRRDREAALAILCVAFGLLFLTFLLSTPPVWTWVDTAFRVPNLAGMLAQSCALVGAVCQQAIVLIWDLGWPGARRRIVLRATGLGLVLAAMVTLYALSVRDMTTRPGDYALVSAGIRLYSVYLLLYVPAYLVVQGDVARLCLRYASRITPRVWLRRGLRTAAAGAIAGLVYCLVRLSDVAAPAIGVDAHRWEPVAQLGASLGACGVIAGWTMPSWGPRLSAVAHYRSYWRLRPLWQALHEVVPHIALARATRLPVPGFVRFRLIRTMVEIRDARIALTPFFVPEATEAARQLGQAEGLAGEQLDAVVEAATLAAAIDRAKSTRAAPGAGAPTAAPAGAAAPPPARGGEHAVEELTWLVQVAEAFRHSPVVTAALAHTRHVPELSQE